MNYRAIPTLTYYRQKYPKLERELPVSTTWGEGTLSLPLYPSLTEEEQRYVIATVLELCQSLAARGPEVHGALS